MKRKNIKEKIDNCSDHLRWMGELFNEYADNIDNKSDYLEKFEILDELLFCHSENLKIFCIKRNKIASEMNNMGVGRINYN